MKKILITGMNKAQCTEDFFLRQQLQVVPSQYAVLRCLREMGYEVEQREVSLGEDISHYDEVIFYMHSPQSFCQNLYSGCYALSQRPDAILAFDDWQVDQIYGGIQGFRGNLDEPEDKAFRQYLLDLQCTQYDINTLKKYKDNFVAACDIMLNKENRLLISAFDLGDLSLLNLGWNPDKIYRFNPNPYHYNRTPDNDFLSGVSTLFGGGVEVKDKKLEWNFASLVQKKTRKWLKLQNIQEWPMNIYGAKRGEEKSERLTEDQMCKVYAEQWGCLMPGYFHSGSGWWRARPLQVADAGSILIGDPKELFVYYQDEYLSTRIAEDIEAMNVKQLQEFAQGQRDALYKHHPLDKEKTRSEFEIVLNA